MFRDQFRLSAIAWGAAVFFGSAALFVFGADIVMRTLGHSTEEFTAVFEDWLGRGLVPVLRVIAGVAAGLAAGLAAPRRETLHAAVLVAVIWIAPQACAVATGVSPTFAETSWENYLVLLTPLLGGLAVEWIRARRRSVLREGHRRCSRCGFWAAVESPQCPRCGRARRS